MRHVCCVYVLWVLFSSNTYYYYSSSFLKKKYRLKIPPKHHYHTRHVTCTSTISCIIKPKKKSFFKYVGYVFVCIWMMSWKCRKSSYPLICGVNFFLFHILLWCVWQYLTSNKWNMKNIYRKMNKKLIIGFLACGVCFDVCFGVESTT